MAVFIMSFHYLPQVVAVPCALAAPVERGNLSTAGSYHDDVGDHEPNSVLFSESAKENVVCEMQFNHETNPKALRTTSWAGLVGKLLVSFGEYLMEEEEGPECVEVEEEGPTTLFRWLKDGLQGESAGVGADHRVEA